MNKIEIINFFENWAKNSLETDPSIIKKMESVIVIEVFLKR